VQHPLDSLSLSPSLSLSLSLSLSRGARKLAGVVISARLNRDRRGQVLRASSHGGRQKPAGRGWKRGSESSGWKRGGVKDGENRVAVVGRKTEDGCNKVNSIRHYGGGEAPPVSLVAGWPARRLFSSAGSIRAPQNGRLVVGKVDGACAPTATGLLSRASPRIAVAYARAVRNARWF
jgi:hypothetical protein